MAIELVGLSKSYGDVKAVDHVDLSIGEGEMLVLLGPSGCGKTTTMRSMVGLETPDAGTISEDGRVLFDGERGINVPVRDRNMGMVFQSYAIWPHKSVFDNVAFPLRMKRAKTAFIEERVREVLELVGLSGMEDRGASMLSGGQMQRVAFARSVVHEPAVLLLDEPLSNLDAKLRDKMRTDLREFQRRLGITAVYVTHDQAEALALGDRVVVMNAGKIVQIGTPNEVYSRPATRFVADFLGSANILRATVTGITGGTIEVALPGTGVSAEVRVGAQVGDLVVGSEVWVTARPEDLKLQAVEEGGVQTARVRHAVYQGNLTDYDIDINTETELRVTELGAPRFRPGDAVRLVTPNGVLTVVAE